MQEFETPRWLFEGRPKRGKKVLLDGPAKKAIMRFYFFIFIFAILESNRFEKHCKILTRFSYYQLMPIGYVTRVTLFHIFTLQVCCTDLVITKRNLFLFRHLA